MHKNHDNKYENIKKGKQILSFTLNFLEINKKKETIQLIEKMKNIEGMMLKNEY